MGGYLYTPLVLLLLLLFISTNAQSITDLEVISYVGPASLTTASSKVSFDFSVKNAPVDGSRFVVFEFPAGYLSKSHPNSGLICPIDPANAFTCTSAAQDALAYCFFADNTNLASLSDTSTCSGNTNLLGSSPITSPTAKTLVAVLPTSANFKLTINFLIPPAYPTDTGVTPNVSVYVAEFSTVVTTVSNVVTQTLPSVSLGLDFANAYKWYIRVLSGTNYVFTTSTITVGAGVMHLDATVYPATGSFALLSNLFAGDHITILPPPVMVFKAPQCSVFYASQAEVSAVTSGSLAQHNQAFTGELSSLAISLPNGLLAQRTDADALRVICSGLAFRMVPPSVTTVEASIGTTAALGTQKSVPVAGLIANPVNSPITVEPTTITVAMSGTAVIADTVSAVFTITFPTAPLSSTTYLNMLIPPNVGWTASTTCTLATGTGAAASVPVIFASSTNVTISITQALLVTNTLTCVLTPPFYAQNDVTGVSVSLAHAVWATGTGYPMIAKGTYTWTSAKAGTWTTAALSLTNKYVGDPPGNAAFLARGPSLRSAINDVYVFTFPRSITVNAGAASVCTMATNTGAVAGTATLTPSTSSSTDHVVSFKLGAAIPTGTSTYALLTCTNFQSPSTIVGTITGHAQLTNPDGRIIMEKTMTVSAGLTPDFGSQEASITAFPPETGVVTDIVLTLRPALTGVNYNWNIRVPSLWTIPSFTVVPTCTATYLTNQYSLPFSQAGQNFRLATSNIRLAITTLDPVVITCSQFVTPYITTAASALALSYLDDSWNSPTSPPPAPNVNWPAITPGITPYKSVSLAHPIVNRVTTANFTFLIANTKTYELNSVLKLTFPVGWALSASDTVYTYTQGTGGVWTETPEAVGGTTVCSMYQSSNNLPITNTVISVAADGKHSVAMTIGSSSQVGQGDITVICTNVKTYRGSVSTHVVAYRYSNAAGTVIEETNILLPQLSPATLGWAEAALSHSDLRPARTGTVSLTLRGVTNSIEKDEALCLNLPTDFTMPLPAAAIATQAVYTDVDVHRLASSAGVSYDQAHESLASAESMVSSYVTPYLAAKVYDVKGADVSSYCTLTRDGITLPITAYAYRNTTTDTDTGSVSIETNVCVTLTSDLASNWIVRGAALYSLQCTSVTTSPYAYPARDNMRVYTRTKDANVLDETNTATFPEILPGPLGDSERTLSHDPGQAGREGTLTYSLATLTNSITTGHTINTLLPANWVPGDNGCSAAISFGTSAVPATCTITTVDGRSQLTLAITGTVPADTPLSIAVSDIKPPPYAEAAQSVTVWTATRDGYVVDKTTGANLAEIAPGALASGVGAVLLSTMADSAVSSATFLMYPMPNGIATGGYIVVTLPASPQFPQALDGIACNINYFYDPLLVTTTPTGDILTGADVYNFGVPVSGTTTYDAATMELKFTPSAVIPPNRIGHLACSYLRNPNKHAYEGVRFPARTYTSDGKLVDATTRMAIDSGYPASLYFSVQPPSAALVSSPFSVAPVVSGVDYFGKPVTGGAYVTVLLKRNDNDPNSMLSGNKTQNMVSGASTFLGLSVDTVGYAYQLSAWCYGVTIVDSDPFSVWEGSDSTKFFWPKFPYLEVVNTAFDVSAYVRQISSLDIDDTAFVPVTVRLYDAATRTDVSSLLSFNGTTGVIYLTTNAGLADLNIQVTAVGEYYLSIFSTVGYFLAGETPRFRIVASAAEKEQVLLVQDELTVRAAVTLTNTDGMDAATLATMQTQWNSDLCASLQRYYPNADPVSLCSRLSTVSVSQDQWVIDILPHSTPGARPNSNEIAEVLRQMILDLSSIWHATPSGPYTTDIALSSDTSQSDSWIALGVTSGSLGAGVMGIGGAILYRMRSVIV